jgi:sugar phosphate permease
VEIEIDEEVYGNLKGNRNQEKTMGPLWKNKAYISLVMANTVLYYVLSGIQYWSTFYFVNVY